MTPRESALVLAGREEPDLLTLREITTGRPFADARLVVASACETAFTDSLDLPDETIGLPAGFLQAGTPAVIGTLWPVLDISTALLMTRFYEYHLGSEGRLEGTPLPPAQALRQAQTWLAHASRAELEEYLSRHHALSEAGGHIPVGRQPFAHSYYWAPFVLVGA
jgi:CHAT domain-containing protein